MFFIYIGAIIQSIVFASTLGHSVKRIEQKSKNAEVKLAIKQKQMEELKMTALQSQMNPHFLFNSLNSINNFVLKNDKEKASDYITKFSRLIRVILKSSSSLTIPLSEELGILGLYVKLEQMRIRGGFEYIVNVDGEINLEDVNFIEADGSYSKIYTDKKHYTLSSNLNHFQDNINNDCFARIHRSYIVNLKKVEAFDKNSVVINSQSLPISKSHQKEILSLFTKL